MRNIFLNGCNIWLEYILLHLLIPNLWVKVHGWLHTKQFKEMEKFGLAPTYWNGQRYINENERSQHRWKHEANGILVTFEKFDTCYPQLNMGSILIVSNLSKVRNMQFASCFHLCCDVLCLCMYLCQFQELGTSPNFSISLNCFVCSHPCTYTHKFGIKRCRRMYSNHMLQLFMKILLTWDITAYHKRVYFY